MKIKKMLPALLICICLMTAGYSAWQIYQYFAERLQSRTVYEGLEQYVSFEEVSASEKISVSEEGSISGEGSASEQDSTEMKDVLQGNSTESRKAEPVVFSIPRVDFESLAEKNPEVVGWIYNPGTAINYPIVQGADNEYYLNHMFDGQVNSGGSIFMDCRNSKEGTDFNQIIYGHSMKNGSMFRSLIRYEKQFYYEEHPKLAYVTPKQSYVVEIFAGYVADVEDAAWQVDFADDEERSMWIEERIRKSCIDTGIVPGPKEQILTLSTCSYAFENARFVLFGVLRMNK